jgi:hypothetical protein
LAIDPQGYLCIGGETYAADLPATPGCFSGTYGGGFNDAWAAKLDPTGSSLVFATYVGGSASDIAYCLATDSQGAIYLSGETGSANFPIAGNPLQPALKGNSDVFVTKVSPSGSTLDYSTYLGGAGQVEERALGITVDKYGSAYVVGWTGAPDFPFTPGGIDMGPPEPGSGPATFVAKLAADGSSLVYADRFSGKALQTTVGCQSIVVNDQGCAFFCGYAWPPYLVTPDALVYSPGKGDGFVTVLSPLGLGLTYSTLWGATHGDEFDFLKLDAQENVYLLGGTVSPDFPTTPGAYDSTLADPGGDLCIVKMSVPSLPYGTVSYGSGTPGCYGPQTLRTEASLKVGNPKMTLECDNVPASSLGLILVSDTQDANGSDPLLLGVQFHVGLSPNLFGLNIVSTTANLASLTVPLPNLSGLVGSTFYAQAFWLWPGSTCAPSPYGLSASSGLALTVIP